MQLCWDNHMLEAKQDHLIGDRAHDCERADDDLRQDV